MIRRASALAAIVLAAGALGACHRSGGQVYGPLNGNICRPFHTGDGTQINTNDQAAVFDDCLHRWAYSLAPARDQADVVASAVSAACSAGLSRWNQQTLSQPAQPEAGMSQPGMPPQPGVSQGAPAPDQQQATDLTTGQPTDMMTARAQFAQSRALFYVVEARAGGCAPPSGKPPANEP